MRRTDTQRKRACAKRMKMEQNGHSKRRERLSLAHIDRDVVEALHQSDCCADTEEWLKRRPEGETRGCQVNLSKFQTSHINRITRIIFWISQNLESSFLEYNLLLHLMKPLLKCSYNPCPTKNYPSRWATLKSWIGDIGDKRKTLRKFLKKINWQFRSHLL